MNYRQRVPGPPLDAFVDSIWICQNDPRPHALERIMPTGAAQLIINLKEDRTRLYDPEVPSRCISSPGSVLSGARSRFQIIDTSEQEYVAGVAFKPGGTVPFVPVPPIETNDADVPLESLWGRARTSVLRESLLEPRSLDERLDRLEAGLRAMWNGSTLHPAVAFALSVFDRAPRTPKIAAVSEAIGLSAKRFIERFKNEVGMTPKRYCRVRRFQQALAQAHRGGRVDWAEVALECGYFDQAHFIHDFRSFSGLTPNGYQSARTSFQNHVKFLQSGAEDV